MFDWKLFILLTAICIPGIILIIPNNLRLVKRMIDSGLGSDRPPPSQRAVVLATFVQTLVLVILASAVGVLLSPSVGLGAPFFQALVTPDQSAWVALRPQLLPIIWWSIPGSLVFLFAYYRLFGPRLDPRARRIMWETRINLGLLARLLYGGIVEEVLMRWGLMTLLVWIFSLLAGSSTPAVFWMAILISGILFGLGHVPGVIAAGAPRSNVLLVTQIALNLWAAVIFSWLFWHYGLAAAMGSHMLFHIIWYPFDLRFREST